MSKFLFTTVAAALMVTAACGSPAAAGAAGKVAVVQAPSPALMPGATYAWAPIGDAMLVRADPQMANSITEQRLRGSIDAVMAAKGFRQVASPAAAQLLVSYHVKLEGRSELHADGYGARCGPRGCWGAPDVSVRRTDYTLGVLILDLRDARTGALVWRAASQKRVSPKDVSAQHLTSVVADMTRSLPRV